MADFAGERNRGLTTIASLFERHQTAFHFDNPSVPLIYLLLFAGAAVRTFGGLRAAHSFRHWCREMPSRTQ